MRHHCALPQQYVGCLLGVKGRLIYSDINGNGGILFDMKSTDKETDRFMDPLAPKTNKCYLQCHLTQDLDSHFKSATA